MGTAILTLPIGEKLKLGKKINEMLLICIHRKCLHAVRQVLIKI